MQNDHFDIVELLLREISLQDAMRECADSQPHGGSRETRDVPTGTNDKNENVSYRDLMDFDCHDQNLGRRNPGQSAYAKSISEGSAVTGDLTSPRAAAKEIIG